MTLGLLFLSSHYIYFSLHLSQQSLFFTGILNANMNVPSVCLWSVRWMNGRAILGGYFDFTINTLDTVFVLLKLKMIPKFGHFLSFYLACLFSLLLSLFSFILSRHGIASSRHGFHSLSVTVIITCANAVCCKLFYGLNKSVCAKNFHKRFASVM